MTRAGLSEREIACLKYLTDKMEAPGSSIGRAVAPWKGRTEIGYAIIGNRVARSLMMLHEPRLVSCVSDLNAWRITPAGRLALRDAEGKKNG